MAKFITVTGKTLRENAAGHEITNHDVICTLLIIRTVSAEAWLFYSETLLRKVRSLKSVQLINL